MHYNKTDTSEKTKVIGVVCNTEQINAKMYNDFDQNRIIIIDIDEFEIAKGIHPGSKPESQLRSCYIRETDFGQKGSGSIYPQVPSKQSFLNW